MYLRRENGIGSDAVARITQNPTQRATEACDVILANCYPFWESCHIDYSLVYMKQMYQQAVQAGKGLAADRRNNDASTNREAQKILFGT